MDAISIRKDGSKRVSVSFPKDEKESVSVVKPEFADDCDINRIVNLYTKKKIPIPLIDPAQLVFSDLSGDLSYFDALRVVRSANELFAGLPSDIRNRFNNNPGQLLEFYADPKNKAECIKLGLMKPDPIPQREKAEPESSPKGLPPEEEKPATPPAS